MDLLLIETGNGGDLQIKGNDLAIVNGWSNMVYLAMFGGNIEGVTKEKLPTEHAVDWWGNNLLFPQDSSKQFNSLTERTLYNVALTSSGRVQIEQAVKKDLDFMKDFAEVSVKVTIIDVDKIEIIVYVRQPDSLEGRIPDAYKAFIFIWDATLKAIGDFKVEDFNDDFRI